MKRVSICCHLVLAFLAVTASAYLVHEEPEEDGEAIRGKRQQNGAVVIDSIFNIPITAIKQTAAAVQNLSPENSATIDSVLKIPVTTLEAVGNLIKNRQENKSQETTPSSSTSRPSRKLERRHDATSTIEVQRLRREEMKKRIESQRQQQRLYQEQLQRRRLEQLQKYTRRMQQQIVEEDERTQHRFYRNPSGFNALTKWIVGPNGVFNGHAGHGDGHVYQYFNEQKPLHFGGHGQANSLPRQQGTDIPKPTKPTIPQSSTDSSTSPTSDTISTTTTTTTTTTTANPVTAPRSYRVHEVIDEGDNPFTWPNWFGIIQVLTSTAQTHSDDRIQNKKTKVKFDEQPLQNTLKEADYYESKYAKAKKNYKAQEEELTGNEIDSDVGSDEDRLSSGERAE